MGGRASSLIPIRALAGKPLCEELFSDFDELGPILHISDISRRADDIIETRSQFFQCPSDLTKNKSCLTREISLPVIFLFRLPMLRLRKDRWFCFP